METHNITGHEYVEYIVVEIFIYLWNFWSSIPLMFEIIVRELCFLAPHSIIYVIMAPHKLSAVSVRYNYHRCIKNILLGFQILITSICKHYSKEM